MQPRHCVPLKALLDRVRVQNRTGGPRSNKSFQGRIRHLKGRQKMHKERHKRARNFDRGSQGPEQNWRPQLRYDLGKFKKQFHQKMPKHGRVIFSAFFARGGSNAIAFQCCRLGFFLKAVAARGFLLLPSSEECRFLGRREGVGRGAYLSSSFNWHAPPFLITP